MLLVSGQRRFRTTRQRLGLGVLLSALVHLLALGALVALVVGERDAAAPAEAPATEEITISEVGEAMLGPAGWGASAGTPAPQPASPSPAAPRRASYPNPRGIDQTVKLARPAPRRPVATARTATPAARPLVAAPATAPVRPVASASAPPAAAPPASRPQVTAIDVGGTGATPEAPGGGDRLGQPRVDPVQEALAAFRAQLKQAVRTVWRPLEVYKRVDPEGRLTGSLLVTAMQVRLRADGSLEQVAVSEGSGVRALDEEALGAIRRMKAPGVPAVILDDRGGYDVRYTLTLEVGMFRFAREVHKAIADAWRPSLAYRQSEALERKTVVRLTVSRDGVINQAAVITPAGIDFLDAGALAAVKPGMRLPALPPAFKNSPGPISLFVAFSHHLGELHVLRPRERVDEE